MYAFPCFMGDASWKCALGHVRQTGPALCRYIPENITIIPPEAELGSTVVDNVKNFFTNKLKAIGK